MSKENKKIEDVTFQALANPTRRTLLRIVQSRSKVTYTELITELGLPTGKLNYHLEQLRGILEKDINHFYVLTPFGKKAVEHLNLIEQRTSQEDEKFVAIAAVSQKTSLQPLVKMILTLGIIMFAIILSIWGVVSYIAISQGAPIVVYILMPMLFAFGIGFLVTLVYALLRTPRWIKRFEQRYFSNERC